MSVLLSVSEGLEVGNGLGVGRYATCPGNSDLLVTLEIDDTVHIAHRNIKLLGCLKDVLLYVCLLL